MVNSLTKCVLEFSWGLVWVALQCFLMAFRISSRRDTEKFHPSSFPMQWMLVLWVLITQFQMHMLPPTIAFMLLQTTYDVVRLI